MVYLLSEMRVTKLLLATLNTINNDIAIYGLHLTITSSEYVLKIATEDGNLDAIKSTPRLDEMLEVIEEARLST